MEILKDEKHSEIEKLAASFGLNACDENFYKAFDFSILKKSKKKAKYVNSPLATLGDAVIKLYLTNNFYSEYEDSGTITKERIAKEKNKELKKIAENKKYHELIHGKKNQESDNYPSDYGHYLRQLLERYF